MDYNASPVLTLCNCEIARLCVHIADDPCALAAVAAAEKWARGGTADDRAAAVAAVDAAVVYAGQHSSKMLGSAAYAASQVLERFVVCLDDAVVEALTRAEALRLTLEDLAANPETGFGHEYRYCNHMRWSVADVTKQARSACLAIRNKYANVAVNYNI